MDTKPLFILEGNGPIANRGCEAILRSTVALLRETFGPCRFLHAPGSREFPAEYQEPDPDITHLVRSAPSVRRFSGPWWHRQFRRILMGPGANELFYSHVPESVATLAIGGDNYTFDYSHPKGKFLRGHATLRQHKPLILWGASVGPFDQDPVMEQFAAKELRRFTLICSRESETTKYLASIGVTDNVRNVADPAFLLEPRKPPLDDQEEAFYNTPFIGLNLSPLAGKFHENPSVWLDLCADCINRLLTVCELPVCLIPHVICSHNNDHSFLASLLSKMQYPDRVALAGPHYNANQYKWIISRSIVFIGARTHTTIASLSSEVPTISISYSMKARGINLDIFGNKQWLLPVNDLTPDRLAAVVQSNLNSTNSIKTTLKSVIPTMKERARQAAMYLQQVIDLK